MDRIGRKIRRLRENKGITQEYMAMQLDLTQSNYGRLEKNDHRLNVPRLRRIAEVLDVNLTDLFRDADAEAVNVTPVVKQGESADKHLFDQKALYESYIESLKREIDHLREEIDFLKEIVHDVVIKYK